MQGLPDVCWHRIPKLFEVEASQVLAELWLLHPISDHRWNLHRKSAIDINVALLNYPPIRMASASWHAFKVDSGRGSPNSSIAHPPKGQCLRMRSMSGDFSDTISKILTASATTSGPAANFSFKEMSSDSRLYQSHLLKVQQSGICG